MLPTPLLITIFNILVGIFSNWFLCTYVHRNKYMFQTKLYFFNCGKFPAYSKVDWYKGLHIPASQPHQLSTCSCLISCYLPYCIILKQIPGIASVLQYMECLGK